MFESFLCRSPEGAAYRYLCLDALVRWPAFPHSAWAAHVKTGFSNPRRFGTVSLVVI